SSFLGGVAEVCGSNFTGAGAAGATAGAGAPPSGVGVAAGAGAAGAAGTAGVGTAGAGALGAAGADGAGAAGATGVSGIAVSPLFLRQILAVAQCDCCDVQRANDYGCLFSMSCDRRDKASRNEGAPRDHSPPSP